MADGIVEDILHRQTRLDDFTANVSIWTTRLLSRIQSDTATELPVELSTLHQIRCNPYCSLDNLRIDSTHLITQELKVVDLSKECWIVDTTLKDEGRDLSGLLTLANNVHPNTKLFYATSPNLTPQDITSAATYPLVSDASYLSALQRLSDEMRVELLVGIQSHPQQSAASTPSYCKAIAISCNVGQSWDESVSSLTPVDIMKLRACARTQLLLKDGAVPPLFIYLPLFCDTAVYVKVLEVLSESKAQMDRVVLCQLNIDVQHLSVLIDLLTKYPSLVCFDTFGYDDTFIAKGKSSLCCKSRFLSNEHILQVVEQLLLLGFGDRILASSNIYTKLQLLSYGGHGFQILQDIQQQPCGNLTTLGKVSSSNYLRILSWRKAVEVKVIEVDKLTCHICQQQFIPGNHYSKFSNEYCTKKCLFIHRDRNWK